MNTVRAGRGITGCSTLELETVLPVSRIDNENVKTGIITSLLCPRYMYVQNTIGDVYAQLNACKRILGDIGLRCWWGRGRR